MPTPKKGESRSDYIARCIPYVKKEDPSLSHEAVVGKCFGLWRQRNKKKGK